MPSVLTIDPGKLTLAYGVWDGQLLVHVALSRPRFPAGPAPNLGIRAMAHSYIVPQGADVVVVEEMVHYPDAGRKDSRKAQQRKAKDLLDLQAIGALVAGRCVSSTGSVVYTPAGEWKGQVEKRHTQHGVEKALRAGGDWHVLEGALASLNAQSLGHNLWDVAGIGLWYNRRYRVR